jgi:DNA-directed RNA polymerase specialized sigma24 family protein
MVRGDVSEPSSISSTLLERIRTRQAEAWQRSEIDQQFTQRVVEVVRAEFEPRTWDAFWRIVVEGQSPAEVAQALGLSLPAVYQAKSRVLRRLRREWKDTPR